MTPAKTLDLELQLSLIFDEELNVRGKTEVRAINKFPLILKGDILARSY